MFCYFNTVINSAAFKAKTSCDNEIDRLSAKFARMHLNCQDDAMNVDYDPFNDPMEIDQEDLHNDPMDVDYEEPYEELSYKNWSHPVLFPSALAPHGQRIF